MHSLGRQWMGWALLMILALSLTATGCIRGYLPDLTATFESPTEIQKTALPSTAQTSAAPVNPTISFLEMTAAPPVATTPAETPVLISATPTALPNTSTHTATHTLIPGPCELAQDLLPAQETTRLPGEYFTQIWRLRNTGSCTWTNNYAIAWSSGESYNSPLVIEIGANVSPGEVFELIVPLRAPEMNGEYMGVWAFINSRGQRVDIAARSDDLLPVSVRVRPNLTPSATIAVGSLSGRVTRNAAPVPAGVAILLEDQAKNILFSTTTNSEGRFSLNNVPLNSQGYNLVFSQELNPQYLSGQVVNWAGLGPVTLTSGGVVTLPDLEIDPLGFVQASPAPNAVVSAASITTVSPLRFEWQPYPVANSYWVNLTRGDRQFTVWTSGLTGLTAVLFDGVLSDGTRIQSGDFWWGVGAQRSWNGYILTVLSPMSPLTVTP